MSMIRFVVHDRENGPTGEIVRFSVYEGADESDLCFSGKLCIPAAKYDALCFSLQLCASMANHCSFDVLEPVV